MTMERDESTRPWWQRFTVSIVSSRAGSSFFRKVMHRVDRPLMRLSRGRLGFASGYPALLLTTTGAKTGKRRTVPVLYIECASGMAIIGTRFGSTRHPGWYHNLRAHPEAMVEIRGESGLLIARDADSGERAEVWARAVKMYSGYERYAARASRTIPILILTPSPIE